MSRRPLLLSRKTCVAESGQSKSLVVLGSEAWEEKATIPLNVGRRFFRVKGEDQPLPDVGEVRAVRWVPCCISADLWTTNRAFHCRYNDPSRHLPCFFLSLFRDVRREV